MSNFILQFKVGYLNAVKSAFYDTPTCKENMSLQAFVAITVSSSLPP